MFEKMLDKYKQFPIQVKASVWFLLCSFFQKGVSVITTPIFTRLLSTAEYGEYSVYNSWLGIISIFITLNLYAGVYTQGLVKYEQERKEYTSSLQGLVIVVVLIWGGIYLLFYNFWNKVFSLSTIQMLAMFITIWATSVFNFWAAEQRVDYKYKKLVLLTFMVSIIKPIIEILLVINSQEKVTARIVGIAFMELIAYVGLWFSHMRRGKVFYSKKFWVHALKFNVPLVPHYLSQVVLNTADRIMIDKMVSAEKAGIYSLAYSIASLMTLFNNALIQTINPWFYRKIKEKKLEGMPRIAYTVLIFVAVANVILIAFAPEVVSVFAPSDYKEAIWIIPPVAMSMYFMFAYSLFACFEFYYEKTNYIAGATMIGAVCNIILNFVFIKIFGYYAAGYTTLICYILYSLFHYYSMRAICREVLEVEKVYDKKILLTISVLFLVIGFIFLFLYQNVLLRYTLILGIFIVLIIERKHIWLYVNELLKLKKM